MNHIKDLLGFKPYKNMNENSLLDLLSDFEIKSSDDKAITLADATAVKKS